MASKYMTSLLEPGEQVLYEAEISRKYVRFAVFVPFLLACTLVAVFIFAFEQVGTLLDNTRSPGLGLTLLWLACGGIMMWRWIIVVFLMIPYLPTVWGRRFSECVVTERRVICKLNHLAEYQPNTFVSLIPLSALRAVEIQQNRWEKLFDCGTVTLLGDADSVQNQYGWISLFGRVKMNESPNNSATVPLDYVAAPFALKAFLEKTRDSLPKQGADAPCGH